jgi:hypothetical protein
MPIGISIIMNKKKYKFTTADELDVLIAQYFEHIKGVSHQEERPGKTVKSKPVKVTVWDREPEPATVAGLALYLGFSSRQALELCEVKGKYASVLKRARLRIEELYEKKLHTQYTSGAIFALKSMGWNERTDTIELGNIKLKIEIVQSGPQLAASEKEVVLE